MVALYFNLIMGRLLPILLFLGIIYIGYRLITKPFRDYVKAAKKQERFGKKSEQKNKNTSSPSEDLGDFIDYEEVE